MRRRTFLKTAAGATAIVGTPPLAWRALAQDKKVLRMGMSAEVLTLDPIKTVYGPDIIIQGIMYSRLLRANADRSETPPGLSQSAEVSDDGLT